MSRIIMAIPDLHLPFEHPDALEFCKEVKKAYKPDIIIQMGDFDDQYFASLFNKDPDAWGVSEEIEKTKEKAHEWYKLIGKNGIILQGNHSARYIKRTKEVGVPPGFLKPLNEILEMPKNIKYMESVTINGVLYIHGEPYSGPMAARNMLMDLRCNVVHGHLHSRAGVTFRYDPILKTNHFVLSTGCLIDPTSYAAHYTKKHRDKPILGCGLIVDGTPIFEVLK